MPKRDATYMQAQRETIARAALDVLLEKGVYATSLRDICKAAGISIGALYTHFKTKEEAIVAACALDHINQRDAAPAADWASYVATYCDPIIRRRTQREVRRFRLSLQFVAELAMMDRNPEGLSAIYLLYRERIASSLRHLAEKGMITLPLGLERTTEIHMQMMAGAEYQVASDPELSRAKVADALATGLAITAGAVDSQSH